jgi:hypothetical protein
MPINRAFQRLKKPRKDGFPLLCNPSKIKGSGHENLKIVKNQVKYGIFKDLPNFIKINALKAL